VQAVGEYDLPAVVSSIAAFPPRRVRDHEAHRRRSECNDGSRNHMIRRGCLAVAGAIVLLALPSLTVARARSVWSIECQHPIVTGVEIYRLRHISTSRACPVALALFRWEIRGRHRLSLYRCHELGQRHPHPHLRLHAFRGWRLSLTPDFVMTRHGASFAISGAGFPLDCG
jgi:hypothetical protein